MKRYYSDPKDKRIYAHIVVKGSDRNIQKYLFSENKRLNAIIDDYEDRIEKVLYFISQWEKYTKEKSLLEVSLLDLLYIKDILGGEDICHVEEEKVKVEDK